jgi:hypothetical protein
MARIVGEHLIQVQGNVPGPFRPVVTPVLFQDHVLGWTTRTDTLAYRRFWVVRVTWDGTVAIQYLTEIEPVPVKDIAAGAVSDAWKAAVDLLRALESYGPAYMTLVMNGSAGAVTRKGDPLQAEVRRGPVDLEPPAEEMLQSVQRELQRAGGEYAHEPEAPDAGLPEEDDNPESPADALGDTPSANSG